MGKTAYGWASQQIWAMDREQVSTVLDVALGFGEDIASLESRLGRELDNTRTMTYREGKDGKRVATLPIHGVMSRYANMFSDVSGTTSYQMAARDFRTALEDSKVKAILLDVDSPGGDANGCNAFAEMVYQARGTKPVIAYAGYYAASAAYWLSSAATRIVADDTAQIGSIGCIMTIPKDDPKEKSHEFVSYGSPLKNADPATKDGREIFQARVNQMGDIFINKVARNMGVDPEQVKADFGRGGILIGASAVEVGMAHELGTYEQLVGEMLSNKERIISYPKRGSQGASVMANENDAGIAAQENAEIQAAARMADMQAKLDALNAKFDAEHSARVAAEQKAAEIAAKAEADKIDSDAAAFADKLVSENKLTPAQRDSYCALHKGLASLSADSAKVIAASGEAVSPLQAFCDFAGSLKSDNTDLGVESVAARAAAMGAQILANADQAAAYNDDDVVARMNAQRGHTK